MLLMLFSGLGDDVDNTELDNTQDSTALLQREVKYVLKNIAECLTLNKNCVEEELSRLFIESLDGAMRLVAVLNAGRQKAKGLAMCWTLACMMSSSNERHLSLDAEITD
ncbi:hypothetical protein KSP40_PGU018480 [Platanthera guangdongensis]|uniref:Uncharacterized protein n=1 Tax=Platanthera guangdongensis TaxID=2320717 RepID=A0ABR2LUA2_9ASPA